MRTFWIDFHTDGRRLEIKVGRGDEDTEFMSRSWEENPAPQWPPSHVAFTAWNNKVDFHFCIPGESLFYIGPLQNI